MTTRGNVTQRVANGVTTNLAYDITGMAVSANDGQGHSVAIEPEDGTNNAVPGRITVNGEQNSQQDRTFSSWLGVIQHSLPNNVSAT
jgi:hypothetical protein